MSFINYPIKFHPILKPKIWGGNKLRTVLNKPTFTNNIGESWELSGVNGDISVIANGPYAGQLLTELLDSYGTQTLGDRLYSQFGNQFPLLIKFIDAKEDLSIQLHPNDELAAQRHDSFGKTEMWYVMQADHNSNLIVGFKDKIDSATYLRHLEDKTLTDIMNFEPVEPGDTYFIEVGRVHAIGAGVMLAEIQQTSDITYRVYDWDRVDDHGQARELHNDLAIEAIDFDMPNDFKVNYETHTNHTNSMVECPYFKTSVIPLQGTVTKENTFDSFLIYICVAGEASVSVNGYTEVINTGETLLVPANAVEIVLQSQNARLLEVYV
ncbi:type I phosphomannose isomerase catalytic subunit [Winogradskyella aurantiaca]|uniref:type I phosphomannose isomerase catalytic subunit n=1 Tax=Winogradskyella aurantiaca TaxID=2219558 RepID=UPI000E1D6CDB|nr:type I phosphomannose isomerase catalytic subunit [Winogradskyella aurantiaca]